MQSIRRENSSRIDVPDAEVLAILMQHPEVKYSIITDDSSNAEHPGRTDVAYAPNACILEYALGDGRSLYVENQSGRDLLDIGPSGIAAYLATWPHLEEWENERALLMQEYGFDGLSYLEAAPEDHDGPCRVWRKPHYYEGTVNAPRPDFVRVENGDDIREFDTRAEAQAYVDKYTMAPSGYDGILARNVLSHGQYAADTLTVVVA